MLIYRSASCVQQIQACFVLLVCNLRLVLQLHSISGSLVVCNAVDLTDVAADITVIAADVSQQQCYVISDGESDILNPFVEQKATLTIGLCPLPDLFAAISVSWQAMSVMPLLIETQHLDWLLFPFCLCFSGILFHPKYILFLVFCTPQVLVQEKGFCKAPFRLCMHLFTAAVLGTCAQRL